jgi:hypothetical protein
MKELTIEEMTSLKGGQKNSFFITVTSTGNSGTGTSFVEGSDIDADQGLDLSVGNQDIHIDIDQSKGSKASKAKSKG